MIFQFHEDIKKLVKSDIKFESYIDIWMNAVFERIPAILRWKALSGKGSIWYLYSSFKEGKHVQ